MKSYSQDFFKQHGKKGGSTTAKRGKEYYKKIGKSGAMIRWTKIKPATSPIQAKKMTQNKENPNK